MIACDNFALDIKIMMIINTPDFFIIYFFDCSPG